MSAECQTFSNNLNDSLRNLIKSLDKDDIKTPRSLLVQMTGDLSAGLMAEYVISWLPYSRKAGGWVYKSWRDWLAECGITQNIVNRVRRSGVLESIGFEIERKKANGAPTLHYRLNRSAFIEALASFLNMSVTYIQSFFGSAARTEETTNTNAQAEPAASSANQLTTTSTQAEPAASSAAQLTTNTNAQTEPAANSVCVESTKSIADEEKNGLIPELKALLLELQQSITDKQTDLRSGKLSDDNRHRLISAYWDEIIATGHFGLSSKQIEEYEAKKAQADVVVVDSSASNSEQNSSQANTTTHPATSTKTAENPPISPQNPAPETPVELPGLTKRELKRYTRKHGEQVVRQVIEYAKQQTTLHTPAAWVKSVLKNAVVDLSEYGITDSVSHSSKKGKYDDFIES